MNRVLPVKTLLPLLCLLLPCMVCRGGEATELIIQGDLHDQKFQPSVALKFYLPAEKLEPTNVDLQLRIARQYRHLMADETKQQEKVRLAGIGKGYAERAAALAPNDAEAHLSIAISLVKMLPLLGTKEKLEVSKRVKTEVDKALALDPTKDLAWYILGCWYQRIAGIGTFQRTMAKLTYGGLPAATNEDAVKCLRRAVELNPGRLIHYVELGRTYAQMGKTYEARKFIEKGLAMPNVGKDDSEIKQRGRETLAKLQ
jgi:tetratricopeptide (TPR) repeat protein